MRSNLIFLFLPSNFVVSTIENEEELCMRVCFSFAHENSGTANNHRNGPSDISY